MNYKISIIVSLIFASLLCSPSYADIIQNGSFENSTTNPGGYFVTLSAGNTQITGWTVLGDTIDYMDSLTTWDASDGSRSLDLNGNGLGGVEQSINTVIGNTYKVTFDLAGNHTNLVLKEMNVNAIGETTQTQSFSFVTIGDHDDRNMDWVTESWTFTADDTITKLQFISTITGNAGPALDNVRVENMSVVPLPGAFLLGLIGMGIAGIKTRKSI